MARSLRWLSATAMLVVAGATGASAQNISNETWLGQIGGTNTITINQSGRNNQAGADNVGLRLNQDGNDNVLLIDQFGHRNQVGATPYLVPPTGINQVGGSNQVEVRQSTAAAALDGTNLVGAIYQLSSYVLQNVSNILTVIQSEVGGAGQAGHGVGIVRQIYTGGDANLPNAAAITQKGGGLDQGNFLGYLTQVGRSNTFVMEQDGRSNAVLSAVQTGSGNSAEIRQVAGDHNRLEYLHQWGFRNEAQVTMEGSRNVVEQIFQFNTHLGSSTQRNIARVVLHGEDNGGTSGFPADFTSAAALAVSAAQANIVQIGEGNDTGITISGEDNRFGVQQFGDGNGAIIAIGEIYGANANGNESAVFQRGDDNRLSHKALGDLNVAAVRQFGDYNILEIVQTSGSSLAETDRGNLADVLVVGHRNNALGSAFTGIASLVVPNADFGPGRLFQNGLNNVIAVNVTGNENSFGAHQNGNANRADMTIIGSGNQVVVVQVSDNNISVTRQFGFGNTAIVLQ